METKLSFPKSCSEGPGSQPTCMQSLKGFLSVLFELLVNRKKKKRYLAGRMYFSHSSVIQIWQGGGVFFGVLCFSKTNPHLWNNETKQRSFSTEDSLRWGELKHVK